MWPSGFQDLGALVFAALAVHEAGRRRLMTTLAALLGSLLCKEVAISAALALPWLPAIALHHAGTVASVRAGPAPRARLVWSAAIVGLLVVWGGLYELARRHGGVGFQHDVTPPGSTGGTPLRVGALMQMWRAVGTAFSLDAAPRWQAGATLGVVLALTLLAVTTFVLRPASRARLRAAFVPSLTNGGLNAWNGTTGRPITEGWKIQSANAHLGEVGLDRMFWRLAREEIAAHPRAAAERLARRVAWYVWPPSSRPEQWMLLVMWPLAVVGVWGLASGAAAGRALLGLAGITWACQALLTSLIVVNERYRYPTDPIVVLVGALGVETLLARLGARRGAIVAGALGIGFAVLVTLVRPLI